MLVLLVLGLAACMRGPDGEALKKDVGERLAQALPPGTVALASLERRGSQSDTKAPAGETRRVIYFDVELRLEREFDFGAWDSPGVAGIVSALGAGPKGISGITSGGNKAGDTVRAHGTALYKLDGKHWQPIVSGGYHPVVAPTYATNAPQTGALATLDAMRKIVDSVPKDASALQRAVIEQELSAAYATIRARLARTADGYAIAAGPEHGQYLRFAHALADIKGVSTIPLVTRGGEDNLRLLRAGKVSIALAQGDAALAAYEGRGNFAADGPNVTLRAAGSLYPEPVHVLVRTDGPITTVGDLKGRSVAIGEQGSASRTTALRVLEAHGLSVKDIKPLELPIGEALVALREKRADAVIQIIGAPADSVRDALAQIPLRLVPLGANAVSALAASRTGYFAHTIARGAYALQKQDVRTVATAAILLVASDLSDSEVDALTRFVFAKGRDFAAHGSAQGAQVSAANARLGLPIPVHNAAARALDAILAPDVRPATPGVAK
jgi:TRAP transporter TAXI family solute receptor